MNTNFVKFSDVLTASIEKLYRVGGLTLVFTFVGVILMVIGNFSISGFAVWVFGVGALLTIACLCLFVYFQIQAPMKAKRTLKENKETMDTIQEIAIELTRATSQLQSLTFKHIKQVDKILDSAIPLLSVIPPLKAKLDALGISDTRDASKIIVETSSSAEAIIHDVEEALVKADAKRLKKYSEELKQITQVLRDALANVSTSKAKNEQKPKDEAEQKPAP